MRSSILAALGAALLLSASACAPTRDDKARLSKIVVVPNDDAEDLARAYRLIKDGKYVIAEMRLRELQEGAGAEITRALADIAFAEIMYQRGIHDRARVLCAKNLMSPYDEIAADAHMILGKIDLLDWSLASARKHFDDARRISRDVQLVKREEKAREFVRFTEALIMFDTGAYNEAKEVLTSFTDPDMMAIVKRIYGPTED
jgi:hypothetical protein